MVLATPSGSIGRGQGDGRAFEILRAMQPLKHAEKLVGISHVAADAVVADEEDLLPAAIP
jgi:hypothetical protein